MLNNSAAVLEERKKRENKEIIYCIFKGCQEEKIIAEELSKKYILAYSVDSTSEFTIKKGIKIQYDEISAVIDQAKYFYSYNKLERYINKVLNKSVLDIPLYKNDVFSVETFLNDKDYFWITASGICAGHLIKIRKADFAIEWIYSPLEIKTYNRRYSKIKKIGDEMFLIPDFASEIDIYNTISDKWKRVLVKKDEKKRLFSDAVLENGSLYLFSSSTDSIYKYNIEEERLEICYYRKNNLENHYKNQNCSFHTKGNLYNGFYYFYSRLYNAILKFDFNDEALLIEKAYGNNPAMTCEFVDNKIILIFKNDYCFYEEYNLDTKETHRFDLPELTSEHAFHCCTFFNNNIYLLPGLYTHSYKIDISKQKMVKYDKFDSEVWNESKEEWKYVFSAVADDKLIGFDGISKTLLILDKNENIKRVRLGISEEEWYITSLLRSIQIMESTNVNEIEKTLNLDYE